jgi:hypothetical protein
METDLSVDLDTSLEAAAHHEAGHAVVDMIYGQLPSLLVIREIDGRFDGECYGSQPSGIWRAEKAIAGCLSQARYTAAKSLGTDDLLSIIDEALAKCLLDPTTRHNCRICFHTAVGLRCEVRLSLSLRDCYSWQDNLHFHGAVLELTGLESYVDPEASATEPKCLTQAVDAIESCLRYINDPRVWGILSTLAEKLSKQAPVRARMLQRDDMSHAYMDLSDYCKCSSPNHA